MAGDSTNLPNITFTHDQLLARAEGIALTFEPVMRGLRIGLWPHGACFVTCLLLNPILRAGLEWDLGIVIGTVSLPEGKEPHSWIESPEGDIIDPTYGMFDGGSPLRVIRSCRRDLLGHSKKFMLSEEDEAYWVNRIQPWTGEGGWRPGCGIKELFRTD